MRKLNALIVGLLFGLGLMVSDMVNPARVKGFLGPFHGWDATLAFVMAGAFAVSMLGWHLASKRRTAVFGGYMPPPPSPVIDRSLIIGSGIFGIGWGLAGICPGPGLVSLSYGGWQVALFVLSMVSGIFLFNITHRIPTLKAA